MGTISKNFSFKEFQHSDTAIRYHIDNTIKDWDVRDNIIALVQNILQPLREAWGQPIFINSGYRSAELNKKVGGEPTSQHTNGQAADCGCSDPLALAKLAVKMRLDFDQCIIYPTFVHFSYKDEGGNRNQVLYSSKYKGPKM